MSEWITDRRPTIKDGDMAGFVWVTTEYGNVLTQHWARVYDRPGMRIAPVIPPKPYVKPKRCLIFLHNDGSELYKVSAKGRYVLACYIPTREAPNASRLFMRR